jgi:hypothetical protein
VTSNLILGAVDVTGAKCMSASLMLFGGHGDPFVIENVNVVIAKNNLFEVVDGGE